MAIKGKVGQIKSTVKTDKNFAHSKYTPGFAPLKPISPKPTSKRKEYATSN